MNDRTLKWIGVSLAAASAVAFGLYPPAAKMAYADGANVSFIILSTTLFRAAALWGFCSLRGFPVWPKGAEWREAGAGGFFQALSILGIISSLAYLPGPVTIILVFTHTIMLLLFMAYRGEIRLSRLALATTLLALFGVSLVVDMWSSLKGVNLKGVSLALLAAFATLTRLYMFGKQVLQKPPPVVGAQTFSAAFVFTLVIIFLIFPAAPESLAGWGWVLLCSASLSLGSILMFYGIASLGSFQFSLLVKLEPIFTALFSFLLLHEVLRLQQYVGMLLVIGSLVAFQCFEKSEKSANEAR